MLVPSTRRPLVRTTIDLQLERPDRRTDRDLPRLGRHPHDQLAALTCLCACGAGACARVCSRTIGATLRRRACPTTAQFPAISAHTYLRKEGVDHGDVITLSFWDSYESIARFSGDPIDRARYYPEDPRFLLDFPEHVEHFDVTE